jgi:hypothetical protein
VLDNKDGTTSIHSDIVALDDKNENIDEVEG